MRRNIDRGYQIMLSNASNDMHKLKKLVTKLDGMIVEDFVLYFVIYLHNDHNIKFYTIHL